MAMASELRKDPLTGGWVVVSAARAKRPSDYASSSALAPPHPNHGPCPFCAGHEHETGAELFALRPSSVFSAPDWRVRVIKNIFPAVSMDAVAHDGCRMTLLEATSKEEAADNPDPRDEKKPFLSYDCMPGFGSHEVVVETPQHGVRFSQLSSSNVVEILTCFRQRMLVLRDDERFKYIQVFKNQGNAAGASMEHSHSQIIALPIIPHNVQREIDGGKRYFDSKGSCVFCDILQHDIAEGSRLIDCTAHFAVIAPYAPRYPYETWIVPRIHCSDFEDVDDMQLESLAVVLLKTIMKVEHLFGNVSFNYMLRTSPVQEYRSVPYYHWSIRIIPRLITLGGFELGSGCHILPVFPEKAASELRECHPLSVG